MPQKTSPTPIPAPNSIANQDAVEYSGLESSLPNLKFPYLLQAIYITNTTNINIANKYSQAKLTVKKLNNIFENILKLLFSRTAQRAVPQDNISE